MSLRDELFNKYVKTLKDWRNEDQQDGIWLTRNEICTILDGIELLEKVTQNRPSGTHVPKTH